MKQKLAKVILISLFCLLFLSPPKIQAKKKLFSGTGALRGRPSLGVVVRPSLRRDRRALIVNFSGLSKAKSVSYTLTYDAGGIPQGVGGTITPTSNSTQRALLFGTCSGNVCRYHSNITGMKFIVTSFLKSGKKVIKSFKVKI